MSRLSRFIHFYTDEDEGNGGGGDPGILKTVTGALLHITDALAKPAYKFTATLEPIQDLHGQDAPYPAGGGKNLVPTTLSDLKARNTGGSWNNNVYSISGMTFTVNNDGTITVNGTSTGAIYFNYINNAQAQTLLAGSYILHNTGSADINISVGKGGSYWGAATTSSVSLTADADSTWTAYSYVASGKTLTNFVLKPMFEKGASESAWSPYSNECPITGHTGASVYRSGADTSNPTTIPITFPDAAGTVYGCTLTINEDGSGELAVDGFLDVMNQDYNGRLQSQTFLEPSGATATVLGDTVRLGFNKRDSFPNINVASNTYTRYMCNLLRHYFAYSSDTPHWYINTQLYLYLPVSLAGSTQESAITYLRSLITAGTPLSIWIPYITPITYQLTSQQVLTLLKGENNVWCDGSDDLELQYYAKAEETP